MSPRREPAKAVGDCRSPLTTHSSSAGGASPTNVFALHSDVMGMATIGRRLDMTSFTGLDATESSQDGEVVSMPPSGGKVTPSSPFHRSDRSSARTPTRCNVGELTGSVPHRRQPTSTVIVPFIVEVPVLAGAL